MGMTSAEIIDLIARIGASIGWTIVGVLCFYVGARIYDRIDPIDYRAEIQKGNVAAAIQMAAVTLAIAALVVVAIAT